MICTVMLNNNIFEREHRLPMLFSLEYPQVLTNSDLSRANALVNRDRYEITGIFDSPPVAVLSGCRLEPTE
jgi:hypothetical protein